MKYLVFVVSLFTLNCYNPDYTTAQGVDVFNRHCGEDCPDPALVDDAIGYYAVRAPDVLNWPDVRSYLSRVRLYWHSDPLSCTQSPDKGCGGLIRGTAIGWDADVHWTGAIHSCALFREITKLALLIQTGNAQAYDSQLWRKVNVIYTEYQEIENGG